MENTNIPQEEPRRLAGYEIAIAVSLLAMLGLCVCSLLASAGIFGYSVVSKQNASATATVQARNSIATQKAEVAAYGFYDPFDDNSNMWETGTHSNIWGTEEIYVKKGVLSWKIKDPLDKGYIDWMTHRFSGVYRDFDTSVDAKLVSGGSSDICYGVIFRRSPDGFSHGAYVLTVCDSKEFTVEYHSRSTDWQTILTWRTAEAIQPREWNRLAVSARGSHFIISINGTRVGEFDDARQAEGHIELSLNIYDTSPGEIWFDNFGVQGR